MATTASARWPRAAVIAIAAAAVVAIVGGAALAIPYLGKPLANPLQPEEPRVSLVAHGKPLALSPWRAGYRELWRVDPDRRVDEGDPGSGASSAAYAGRTKDVVAFTSDTATASGSLLTVSATTGRTTRLKYAQETCSGIVKGELLRCQGGRMGYYPTDLEELATGDSRPIASSQDLGAEIPDGAEDAYGWTTYVVDGVLFASWTTEPSQNEEPQHGNVARINDAGTGFAWRTEYAWHGADHDGRVQHGILTDRSFAVNAETGELLATAATDGGAAVQWVAQDVLQASSSSKTPSFTAPDGSAVSMIERGAIPITTQALPKHPLRRAGGRIEAFDPSTGAGGAGGLSLWSTDVGLAADTGDAGGTDVLAAYHQGRIALVQRATPARAAVQVLMLDESSGAVLWRTTIGRPSPGGTTWEAVPVFAADGSLLVQTVSRQDSSEWYGVAGANLTMFDPSTSRRLWSRPGLVAGYTWASQYTEDSGAPPVGAPVSRDLESYHSLVVNNPDDTWSMLSPRLTSDTSTAAPASAPACPGSMSAVSWIQYADGAILLCREGDAFAVVFPSHPDWWANQLTFTDGGGYEVVFSNRAVLRTTLGGSLVYVDENGSVSAHVASAIWDVARGSSSLTVPSDLPICPSGSWPISLSTFDRGWLLVCGVSVDRPTRMSFLEGGTVTDTTAVTASTGGYCGTFEETSVCAYRAPAVVAVKHGSAVVSQHSVKVNYYSGYGEGGAGEGTGSYGVQVPDSNAKDQVRYLTQILQKSMTGRSNINRAVAHVRSCTNLEGAVAMVASVVANREELLTALDSTPVDAITDGPVLVASLQSALQLSRDSDLIWLQWAQSEQASGCAEGEGNPLYRRVTQMNLDVSAAKDHFVNEWNSRIVPAYAAPRLRTSQI